jgi:uncharacterized protein (DUF2252 family)
MPTITARIHAANTGRALHLLERKYAALVESPFRFFRGTAHLFYEDWSLELPITSPKAWCCGDVHLENFGSYKGNNRLVYFDLNDFDEAALAPCVMDVTRLATSIHLASAALGLQRKASSELAVLAVNAYAHALTYGKAKYVERDTASGMVKALLKAVQKRTRRDFLDKRTEVHKKQRRFILDGERYEAVSNAERRRAQTALRLIASEMRRAAKNDQLASPKHSTTQQPPHHLDFTVLDVAHRIAGTGSLGVERYAVLVEGNGSPNENYILDLKEAIPSAATPALKRVRGLKQPTWSSEAARCVATQQRMQATSPALLRSVEMDGTSFILRELQPVQDKLNLAEQWQGRESRVQTFVVTAAQVLAWAHLRSGGRQGSACADEMIAFGQTVQQWHKPLVDYARGYADRVSKDWREFQRENV